jgi:2-oxoglutarate ferredoxin oxidoreductase subunit delta
MAVKGMIVINEELCKGCGRCIPGCIKNLIILGRHINSHGHHPAVFYDFENNCSGCFTCATNCPDIAIEVFKDDGKEEE